MIIFTDLILSHQNLADNRSRKVPRALNKSVLLAGENIEGHV